MQWSYYYGMCFTLSFHDIHHIPRCVSHRLHQRTILSTTRVRTRQHDDGSIVIINVPYQSSWREARKISLQNQKQPMESSPVSPSQNQHPFASEEASTITTGFLRSHFPMLPWHRLPNTLTYLRCLAVPLFILVYLMDIIIIQEKKKNILLTAIFGLASITDYLDGYLARRWKVTSPFGAFLDPVADKLMVSTALILLSGKYGSRISVPTAIILAREIAVSALREYMAQQNVRDIVQVGWQGKIKTAFTMMAIFILLLTCPITSCTNHTYGSAKLWNGGIILLYISTLLTITSAYSYFQSAMAWNTKR